MWSLIYGGRGDPSDPIAFSTTSRWSLLSTSNLPQVHDIGRYRHDSILSIGLALLECNWPRRVDDVQRSALTRS
jgi:hypothetical protein